MKDHEIAKLVSTLADISTTYGRHGSIRQRIATVLVPILQAEATHGSKEMSTIEQATAAEQLAQLTNAAKLAYFNEGTIGISHEPIEAYVSGYLRARTEQATEIATLKARVAELMPIARFGAMVAAAHMADDLIDAEDLTDGMLAAELLTDDNGVTNYVDGIEEKIMEVLR